MPVNGSRALGFEELCSQLARIETPEGAEFVRKGTPDGGVECFCKLGNGQEWGWQAKFFREPLREAQWKQLDRSVKSALETHPDLVRYFVCIPRNRSDSRRPSATTESQRWEERVTRWEGWAQQRGRIVEFVWWGESEIFDLVSQEGQAGRHRFWFGTDQRFSRPWFDKHLQRAIQAAGPRYTPEVHVDVPIARDFELYGRLEPAVLGVRRLAKDIRRSLTRGLRDLADDSGFAGRPTLRNAVTRVDEVVEALLDARCDPDEKWPLSSIRPAIADAVANLEECNGPLADAASAYDQQPDPDEGGGAHRFNRFRDLSHQADALRGVLWRASERLREWEEVVNRDLMIVTGEAGSGKTHLLCDVANRRLADGQPTVILMGQQFTTRELPWAQARAQLDLGDLPMEQFVGALEAAAQAAGTRALFMIDAVNEGEGQAIWPPHLADLLSHLRGSAWIGVVLSVRSPFAEHVVPAEVRDLAYEVTHRGFADDTYAAVERFCEHYGLEFPATPLLRPEFDNPLFLKTLCEGLRDRGVRRIPVGAEGISAVFGRYLDAIDATLAQQLDYDPQGQVVARALDAVAAELTDSGVRWLPRRRTQDIVNQYVPSSGFSRSLYRALVDSGLLMESPDVERVDEAVVHIGYEWFADHLIAKCLIDRCDNVAQLAAALTTDDAHAISTMTPWGAPLDALGVLVPERFGVELPEVLADGDTSFYVERAFLKGLPWREPTTIGRRCHELLDGLVAAERHPSTVVGVFDALVACATVPDHPLGAASLDERLRRLDMADRDAVWSRYLFVAYGERGSVDRLLDWATRQPADGVVVDPETAAACVTVLSWFLTASDRFVRDRATKGLIALLDGEIALTCELVERFNDVDDLYVRERVMAAAFGVAMRSSDAQGLAPLAQLVYRLVFAAGEPPAHILLRDYARGVIERALALGTPLDIDSTLIEPPYHSTWPQIPTASELEEAHPRSEGPGLYFSVMDHDFARYVIGTNSSSESRYWLSVLNTDAPWQTVDELVEAFQATLDARAREAFDELWRCTRMVERPDGMIGSTGESELADEIASMIASMKESELADEIASMGESELADEIASMLLYDEEPYLDPHLEERLLGMLNDTQQASYTQVKAARETQTPRLGLDIIQRYVLWRAFDLGWTVERFGELDRLIIHSSDRRAGRGDRKPERIGKKYQWIAYHEILALISDRYQYRVFHDDIGPGDAYRGTWQLHVRDIDPSTTRASARPDPERERPKASSWWRHEATIASTDEVTHEQWLQIETDIPSPEQQLRFINPDDSSTWIKLHGMDTWRMKTGPSYERDEVDQREIWRYACGYVIDASAVDEFMGWSQTVDFFGRWMPEPQYLYGLYYGEIGWSTAFRDVYYDGPLEPRWGASASLPTTLAFAAVEYHDEGGRDGSLDEGYSLCHPPPRLVEAMNLRWTGRGAEFVDADGELTVFDPSAQDGRSAALLIREDKLQQYLRDTGSAVVWAMPGEKQVTVAGAHWGDRRGFLLWDFADACAYKDGSLMSHRSVHLHLRTPDRPEAQ